ncbi:MAG TPA: hypothetical protein VNT27_05440 [Propionibacteriaceae bacterium]|nr:hypothetical protein [Propionibacteriaceae bacterium]
MQITRSSTEGATGKGPAEWFTGDVYIDSVAAPAAPSRVLASLVHFMPGARTAWHTEEDYSFGTCLSFMCHPLAQPFVRSTSSIGNGKVPESRDSVYDPDEITSNASGRRVRRVGKGSAASALSGAQVYN